MEAAAFIMGVVLTLSALFFYPKVRAMFRKE